METSAGSPCTEKVTVKLMEPRKAATSEVQTGERAQKENVEVLSVKPNQKRTLTPARKDKRNRKKLGTAARG